MPLNLERGSVFVKQDFSEAEMLTLSLFLSTNAHFRIELSGSSNEVSWDIAVGEWAYTVISLSLKTVSGMYETGVSVHHNTVLAA
jgi:hypothetical protein